MKTFKPARRRFIGIMAASAALAATPWMMRRAVAAAEPTVTSWRGIALGADAELHIHHPDRAFAQKLVERAIAEVQRLELVFSLYREDSALSRLNRDGLLDDAPMDMLRLLQESASFSRMTDGAFDPSVQPLWTLYAETALAARKQARARAEALAAGADGAAAGRTVFGRINAAPSAGEIQQALQRVGYDAIEIDGQSVRLNRPGMALTLNGIAQGYITDRVTELLVSAGLEHALVDMGEIRGLNGGPGDRPWRVGLAGDSEDRKPLQTVEMRNRAVSTSSGRGTIFDNDGALTHLFDPRTGSAKPRYRSVSVMAANATTADALSTAFSLMDEAAIRKVAAGVQAQAWVLREGAQQLTQVI